MINSILLTDFTGFANTRFDFTKGINVLIGKNGTGKTHVLKCLAATLQARHDFLGKNSASKEQFEYILAEDMIFYFKPDVIGNLVNKGVPSGRANITVTIDGKLLQYSFSSASKTTVKLETDEKWDDRHFIGLSSKREISFDQTYINLAHALSLPILRESEDNPLKPAIELLEQELQFKVLQMNGRFYIQTEKGNMEAHLVAEGLRKLASILYLILNGEINTDTILFWDEPEANLNPALVKVVAKFIRVLQECGLQIFVATHDYLLTHTLSLYSEYKEHTNISVKFFGLKKEDKGIIVEESETLAGIRNNPILEEYAAFYDLEQQFINQYE